MQIKTFNVTSFKNTNSNNLQKPVSALLPSKQDQVCFKGANEALQLKVDDLKTAMLDESNQGSLPTEVVQYARILGKVNPNSMWGTYRSLTLRHGTPIPDLCFVKLVDNIVDQMTKNDTFIQKTIQSYFNKKNKSGNINKLDKAFEKFLDTFGMENKKGYVLNLVDIFAMEASTEQKELLKLTLQLNKDSIYKATNADILKQKVDRVIDGIVIA